ncbi:hypothetical protein FRC04_005066, partial [Tulasnella sp. 424]
MAKVEDEEYAEDKKPDLKERRKHIIQDGLQPPSFGSEEPLELFPPLPVRTSTTTFTSHWGPRTARNEDMIANAKLNAESALIVKMSCEGENAAERSGEPVGTVSFLPVTKCIRIALFCARSALVSSAGSANRREMASARNAVLTPAKDRPVVQSERSIGRVDIRIKRTTYEDKHSIQLLFQSARHIIIYFLCESVVTAVEFAAVLAKLVRRVGALRGFWVAAFMEDADVNEPEVPGTREVAVLTGALVVAVDDGDDHGDGGRRLAI